jgi:ParB family transcriptional regulator, chromosome partitioning protein
MTTVDPTLEMLDPATLLVDLNIREAKLDKDFLASVKDHGVIEPIVAVRTEDGAVRVRHGHRRTLAAIEAAQSVVPVFIAGTEDNEEADRIARQWHENKHRAALTNVEEIAAVDQRALLGLSAATIAKRLRSPKRHVESALAVRDSELARAATARYDFLTLEQSAVIADFDDDAEAVKALVAAAKQGDVQFQRAAQAAVEARERAAGHAALVETLTGSGVTVLDGRPDYRLRLDSLTDAEGNPLDAGNHAQCPGHAAYLSEDWIETTQSEPIAPEGADSEDEEEDADAGWQLAWVAVYACTDPAAHGHRSRHGSGRAAAGTSAAEADPAAQDAAKEAARQERRSTLANNKAWREAEPIRRVWLRSLAARKTAPKGAAALITTSLTADSNTVRKAMENSAPLAAELLGVDHREAIEQAAATATDARALVISLVVVLAAYESGTRVDTWRSPMSADRRYFGWLADNGYPLSEVEALAGPKPKGKRT